MSREGRNRQRPTRHDVTKVHWHFLRNSSHFLTIQLSTIQPLAIVKFAIYRRPVDSQLINKQSARSTRSCNECLFVIHILVELKCWKCIFRGSTKWLTQSRIVDGKNGKKPIRVARNILTRHCVWERSNRNAPVAVRAEWKEKENTHEN